MTGHCGVLTAAAVSVEEERPHARPETTPRGLGYLPGCPPQLMLEGLEECSLSDSHRVRVRVLPWTSSVWKVPRLYQQLRLLLADRHAWSPDPDLDPDPGALAPASMIAAERPEIGSR